MPRKKVESQVVDKEVTEMTFFECEAFKNELIKLAEENEGELTDEQVQQLVEAQTQSVAKLHGLCNFMKLLEAKQAIGKQRIDEIKEAIAKAKGIYDRLAGFLAPWVDAQGKSYQCQEYELKTRLSTSTHVPEGFDDPMFCTQTTKVIVTPDKKAIKAALEAGREVPGCELIKKTNLSIK